MKKMTRLLLLLSALTALLCVSALAAEAKAAGIYGTAENGVTITPVGTKSEVEIDGKRVTDFYAGAEKLTVSYSGAQSGAYYLLLVTNTKITAPTVDDIVYIDQQTATAGGVSFTAYPSALGKGEYYVYLSTNATSGLGRSGLEQVGSFEYYVPYKLGDVNEDGKVTAGDAADILQAVVEKVKLDGTKPLAADVDGNGKIEAVDATYILRFVVGKPVAYDLSND